MQGIWNDSPENVHVVGHRGMKKLFPENTLVSFREALDRRVDLVETDVRMSADGVLVICHDETVDRTTDGTGKISDLTLAELKSLDAGAKFSPRFSGERIPTFREFLGLVSSADYPLLLNVEIKEYTEEVCDETIRELNEFGLTESAVIASFSGRVLRYVAEKYPGIRLQGFPGRFMTDFTPETYDLMFGMGIPYDEDNPDEVRRDVALAVGRGIHPWLFITDTEERTAGAVSLGAYNVTGNDPTHALRYLTGKGLHRPLFENLPPVGNMKAAVLHSVGNLRVDEIAVPSPAEDEVIMEVKYCGICGSDIGRILKNGTYHFPTVPGHEFAGRIVYDPENAMTGKRGAVFPLLPCFKCESCRAGDYALCSNYDYYGSRRDGGFEKYLAIKRFNLISLPENVTYEEGAMCEPASVGLRASKTLGIKGGENVLITGAGPVGLCAGMWAKIKGADEVFFTDIDENKLRFAESLGFAVFRADSKNVFDLAIEGTGAGNALGSVINAVKPAATVVLLGNPGGNVTLSPTDYQAILRKKLTLRGTWNSSYGTDESDWRETLSAVSGGYLPLRRLITHIISLDELPETIKKIAARDGFFCKVLVDNER
ncbi:MAG: alcohol dehydrogenase catalytic domain-containing protein [Clostridia bacterium]|nr:alcohol dehydrogenase catalytic domain-containing protein [Clostridia bacterium]